MSLYEEKKTVLEAASEGITAMRISVRDWESKKNNMETLLSRVLEAIDDYEFQIGEKQRQQSGLSDEKDRLVFGSDDARENTAALIEEKQEAEAYIQQVTEERAALLEKINALAAEQQESLNALNSYQDQKYQLEIKAARNDTQLDTLKERLWEDFEISYVQALDLRREDFIMSTSVKESREIRNRIPGAGRCERRRYQGIRVGEPALQLPDGAAAGHYHSHGGAPQHYRRYGPDHQTPV